MIFSLRLKFNKYAVMKETVEADNERELESKLPEIWRKNINRIEKKEIYCDRFR